MVDAEKNNEEVMEVEEVEEIEKVEELKVVEEFEAEAEDPINDPFLNDEQIIRLCNIVVNRLPSRIIEDLLHRRLRYEALEKAKAEIVRFGLPEDYGDEYEMTSGGEEE